MTQDTGPASSAEQQQYPCTSCGAALEFAPGTASMVCPYCGSRTEIAVASSQKHDYSSYARQVRTPLSELPPVSVSCGNCGSTQTTTAVSTRCPSCQGALVVTDDLGGQLKGPDGIVPFVVDKNRADAEFRRWSSSRWFAPNALKKVVKTDSMVGAYLPHWGFDDQTRTHYRGKRGEHYWDTETYTVTNDKGHMETRTRQVQRTRWYPARGQVSRDFVDVLSAGVTDPDAGLLKKLGPWTSAGATSFEPAFLAGFETPRYTVPAESGFSVAQQQMAEQIERDVRADIGGDEQRVNTMETTDTNVLFRLLLMPLWMATFLFAGATYDVYVNANTGEVIGERPYSTVKIALAVLVALLVVVGAIVAYKSSSG